MMLASPAARRLPLLGCLLAAALALALSACGGDRAATAKSTAATTDAGSQTNARPDAAQPCPAKLSALAGSLDRLRRQLEVGLSYEQYAAKIHGLGAAYAAIPVGHLALDCLIATGTPAEKALDRYIDADNAWGECLADAACTTATIEPVLQRKWRLAAGFLSQAR